MYAFAMVIKFINFPHGISNSWYFYCSLFSHSLFLWFLYLTEYSYSKSLATRKMSQWMRCFPKNHEDQSSGPQKPQIESKCLQGKCRTVPGTIWLARKAITIRELFIPLRDVCPQWAERNQTLDVCEQSPHAHVLWAHTWDHKHENTPTLICVHAKIQPKQNTSVK